MAKHKANSSKTTPQPNQYSFQCQSYQSLNFATIQANLINQGSVKGQYLEIPQQKQQVQKMEQRSKKAKNVEVVYEISEILNERWRDGKKQLLVCYKNQNKSDSKWIDSDQIMEVEQKKFKNINKNKTANLLPSQNVALVKKGVKSKIKKQTLIRRHALNHLKIQTPDIVSVNREIAAKKQSLSRIERRNKRQIVIETASIQKTNKKQKKIHQCLPQQQKDFQITENFGFEENESQQMDLLKGFSINNEIVNPKEFKWNDSELKLLIQFYKKRIPNNIQLKEAPSQRKIFNRLDGCLQSDDD